MGTRRQGGWIGFAGLLLLVGPGCHSLFHTALAPPEQAVLPLPAQQEHVYVFFINGFDPLQYADLLGVRDQVRQLGYLNSYYGQLYHSNYFAREMRRVFREDPQARFVMVGFSLGAMPAYELARGAQDEGLPVDLVVLIAGKGLRYLNYPSDETLRVVDIQAVNYVFRAEFPQPADRVVEGNTRHFQAPTAERTRSTLLRELAVVAENVPITLPGETPAQSSLTQMLKPVDQVGGRPVYVHGDPPTH
jgi:hypothetical protein